MARPKTRIAPVAAHTRAAPASRDAGATRGALGSWRGPLQTDERVAALERQRAQRRAADLAANNWCAESALSAVVQNAIGTGLEASARIPAERLGLTEAQARDLGKSFEWAFWRWSRNADIRGLSSFADLQRLGLRTMLSQGEMLHVPVMRPEAERIRLGLPYALALQAVSPTRLRTPVDMESDPAVRDGIRFAADGRPLEYYLAAPKAVAGRTLIPTDGVALPECTVIPARVGARPGVFHLFVRHEDEQIRGWSAFATAIGLFQQLGDAISYELLAQTMAAQFPVFISRAPDQLAGLMPVPASQEPGPDGGQQFYEDLTGPQIMYGNPGEKPEVLKNERPSSNFMAFVKLIQQAIAASMGLPYIVLAKDYSEVNYSSARAAMNEAWRVFRWYRALVAERYCQPVWDMVIEEAVLRGDVRLPAGAPGFHEARDLWTACEWTGPTRGYVDPTKEVQADILARDAHLKTMHAIYAESGRDWDDELPVLRAEQHDLSGLRNAAAAAPSGGSAGQAGTETSSEETE